MVVTTEKTVFWENSFFQWSQPHFLLETEKGIVLLLITAVVLISPSHLISFIPLYFSSVYFG